MHNMKTQILQLFQTLLTFRYLCRASLLQNVQPSRLQKTKPLNLNFLKKKPNQNFREVLFELKFHEKRIIVTNCKES